MQHTVKRLGHTALHNMPDTTFHIPTLHTQDDADAVMFELQDLPCVHQADVNLAQRTAWVSHSTMIAPDDIAAALAEAGYEASTL
jgi:copper chaperone CopZ